MRQFIGEQTKISQDYYPDILGECVVVNAPWAFSSIFALVKGFLDEKTRSKINVVGGNAFEALQEYVDAEQIPDFLGGLNSSKLEEDFGPWSEYEVIDGHKSVQIAL